MKFPQNMFPKLAIVTFLAGAILFIAMHIRGYDSSIGWNVTTSAESEVFFTQPFKKGPFEFSFSGKKYSLIETFAAGPITRDYNTDGALIGFILLGLTLFVAAATTLSSLWFFGTMALFIFLIINMHLPEVGLFGLGARSYFSTIILLAAYLAPAYSFHAFFTRVGLGWRWLTMIVITAAVVLFSGVDSIALQEQFISGSYFGLVVVSLVFLFLIAEENVFGILFLVTQSRGSSKNHVHFSFFSFAYLGIIICHYGNKAGFWNAEVAFFNPFVLLILSSCVALWSIRHKQSLFSINTKMTTINYLYIALGMVVFGFMALAMFRGNDPVYEGYHYFIIYTHVAFGLMFFIYIIWNFANPLGEGLQVYKIAYRSRNFPYVSAKLAGLAIIAGMFFVSNKKAMLLFQSGSYNYLGAQALTEGNSPLANSYFREGSIFGYDNHYSNYQLGYNELQKGNIKEANYRFMRASRRYPSPQTFVNQAGTHAMMAESTPSIVALKNGLLRFPDQNQLLNNLGLTYADLGQQSDAIGYLERAKPNNEWTNAALVNYWKVTNNLAKSEKDYERGNLAVKTNIIGKVMLNPPDSKLPFDTAQLYPSYPLHRLAFLINGAVFFDDPNINNYLSQSLSGQLDEGMYYDAKNAMVIGSFKNGYINNALEQLDYLISEVSSKEQGKYLNQAGLLALSQHAPELALTFFERAIDQGHADSRLNKAACLLELKRFDQATEWADYLISVDSSMMPLKRDIVRLSTKEGLSVDQQLFNIYYNYENYSNAELNSALANADKSFVTSLWAKIANEQMESASWDNLRAYRAVFNAFLDQSAFEEPDVLLSLSVDDAEPQDNHPIAIALKNNDAQEKINLLRDLAQFNSLNEPLVLAISKQLKNLEPSINYEILIDAININQTSVSLRKAYVMSALDNGLEEYAENVLNEIKGLTEPDDFHDFKEVYMKEKATIAETSDW